jgi:threonine dehydrogenase-like Zn-dependent dehydrogenase
MRATVMHSAGDVRIENVPDATIGQPTDAVIRVTRTCICGSDLWPYRSMEASDHGQRMGHEAIGVVEAVGADVRTVKRGNVVLMPFAISDGTCDLRNHGCVMTSSHDVRQRQERRRQGVSVCRRMRACRAPNRPFITT